MSLAIRETASGESWEEGANAGARGRGTAKDMVPEWGPEAESKSWAVLTKPNSKIALLLFCQQGKKRTNSEFLF